MVTEDKYKEALETIRKYNEEKSKDLLLNNLNYAQQQILYDGLSIGNIYPTDIDASMEFDDRFLILFEVKYQNKEIPIGQKLILERIADNWVNSSKVDGVERKAIVLKVSHNIPPDEPMVLADGVVTYMYYNGVRQDIAVDKQINVKKMVTKIAKDWKIKKLQSWYLF